MRALAIAAVITALTVPALAAEREPVEIEEWNVPWDNTRPRDPAYAGSDSVWFVGQRGHYLGRLNPESGDFEQVELADEPGPHNLIVGSDGIVWYAGNLKGYIGRHDPETGETRRIEMPDSAARDPHTLVFDDDESHIWFTVQGGNFVGRLAVDTEQVDLIEVPTPRARPYGIKLDSNGTPWIALFGTNKLASIDRETLELTEHELPREGARPRRLDITSDDRIWYVDYQQGYLGRLEPDSGRFSEWAMPSGGDSRPYGMAVDGRDRVWAFESGVSPNQLVGFEPDDETFFSVTEIPSGGGTIRHVDYDAESGQIWFGADTNTIGYARVH